MRTAVSVIVLLCCVNFGDISNQQRLEQRTWAHRCGATGGAMPRQEMRPPGCEDGVWSGDRRESTLASLTTASRLVTADWGGAAAPAWCQLIHFNTRTQ